MTNIEYFKLQAKNLLKDYKTRHLSDDGDIYEYDTKYFDIVGLFLDYDMAQWRHYLDFFLHQ